MMDLHDKTGLTGVLPTVFGLSTYSLLVGLGLLAGVLYIIGQRRRQTASLTAGAPSLPTGDQPEDRASDTSVSPTARPLDPTLVVISAALIFGLLGAKVPTLLQNPTWAGLLVNKSVVGGLLGGMAGVYLVKRWLKIKVRLGNVIAPAAALGLGIGRIGCFFNGCCAGIAWPWGVDFGDGVLRLPTQLFEAAFQVTAFCLLHVWNKRATRPGLLFKVYVLAYFAFRFLIEFIRINPDYWLGLTLYQLLSLAGILWMGLLLRRQYRFGPTSQPGQEIAH